MRLSDPMNHPKVLIMILLALLAAACAQPGAEAPAEDMTGQAKVLATGTVTVTAMSTATPTVTPASTATPSPTVTGKPTATTSATPTSTASPTLPPTATAQPVTVHGDLRSFRVTTPEWQPGVPCGVVDLLDFPLDPPDGQRASIVQGFDTGRSGSRFHAGEDWRISSSPSFGAAVYSIGHGQVTYAAPWGWGADQGVIVVRHTFPDGSRILSFYGHLHPPSISVHAGDCVKRGEQVGTIGQPRTPSHLHFEIRSRMPDQPGPGYWPTDPILAGWEAPTDYIWMKRMEATPGVQWIWSSAARFSKGLGLADIDTFVMIEGRDLVGIDVQSGSVRWRQPRSGRVDDALLTNAGSKIIYIIDQIGELEAYRLYTASKAGSSPAVEAPIKYLWTVDLDAIGVPSLMPLPDGGVVLWMWGMLFGVSGDGQLLWEMHLPASVDDWVLTDDRLLLVVTDPQANVWAADESGAEPWPVQIGGRLSISGDGRYLYGQQGVYQLNHLTRAADLRLALPRAYPGVVDVLELADGGLLVAHADRHGKRLVVLDDNGTVRWQRSHAGVIPGFPQLALLGKGVYAFFEENGSVSKHVRAFTIDVDSGELTHVFDGGTGNHGSGSLSAVAVDSDRVLISVKGTTIVGLDTRLAAQAAGQAPD